jgi:hypothetical protein
MYDRLIVPYPADSQERARWFKKGWDPDRLDSILKVLRADGDERKRHAITVPWNEYAKELFNQRAETAKIVNDEANYGMSRRLLATDLLPPAPPGVIPVAVLAAYPSIEDAQEEWIPNAEHSKRETLTVAIAHQFLAPAPNGKTDLDLLQEAVDLADDAEFQKKRAQMYQWQEGIIQAGISDANALQEMAQYIEEYNLATKRAVRKVYTKFAFTLIPIAITAVAGPLTLVAGAGAIANLVKFWIYDRKPVVEAGESQAAAMLHTIHEELGWQVPTFGT